MAKSNIRDLDRIETIYVLIQEYSRIFRERYSYPEISVTDNGFSTTLFNRRNGDCIIDRALIR